MKQMPYTMTWNHSYTNTMKWGQCYEANAMKPMPWHEATVIPISWHEASAMKLMLCSQIKSLYHWFIRANSPIDLSIEVSDFVALLFHAIHDRSTIIGVFLLLFL